MFPRLLPLAFLAVVTASSAFAESRPAADESPIPTSSPLSESVASPGSVDALRSVQDSILLIEAEIKEAQSQLSSTAETEKPAVTTRIQSLIDRQKSLKDDFEAIATGIDPEAYEGNRKTEFVLTNEVNALLEPIIGELKALTEKPREIEELKSELARWKSRVKTTEAALSNLAALPGDELTAGLEERVAATRTLWETRQTQADNRIQAITFQLEQAERSQPSFIETARDGFRSFYKSRGRNFLLCLLAFFTVFFGLRYLHQRLDHYFPWKKKERRPFYLRLIDVGLNALSLLGAVAASLITLYATGDWVLMGLALILLFGIALAAKNALPRFYDQGRILLNLGEVREGERVTFNGIPWRIDRLSFYTTLRNPDLRGGMIRLPVNQLGGMISRPISEEGELWFPCHEGDWIMLPDEGHGRVVAQTPEYVQIVKLGGAKIMIPTTDFLSRTPMNLSPGFRISSLFGIDYDHQAESTTTIPATMWAFLTREMGSLIGDHEKLIHLKVEFAAAGASSLDLAIIADFDGSLAPKYQVFERALQRFAVDCCNENGWTIPFTQITLHNAFSKTQRESPAQIEETPKLP